MLRKVVVGLVALMVLLAVAALSPALLPEQQAAAQGGTTEQPGKQAVEEENNGERDTDDSEPTLLPVTGNPALAQVVLDQMTLVWVHEEDYAHIIASCAGSGLRTVAPHPDGPKVLIPNAGDLDVAGSTVAIKLQPDGQVEFIPRTQSQLIRVPVDVGDKVAGQEVLSLSFAEGMQLMRDGYLTWTAQNDGPFGNGFGLPGHIATCDPSYPGDDFYRNLLEDDEDLKPQDRDE